MANFMAGWLNQWPLGTTDQSSAVAGLFASNLQNDQGSPASAWQTTSTTGSAKLTLPAAATFRVLSIHRTNLTAAASIRWRVWPGTDQTATPVYDSGTTTPVVAGYQQAVCVLPGAVSGRTVQVDISDAGNPDGFLSVALAYAGPVWQPVVNFDANSAAGRTEQTDSTITRSGAAIIRNRWTKRTATLSLSGVAASDVWGSLMDLDLYGRRGSNVLLIPDPADTFINRAAVFGTLAPTSDITYPSGSAKARGWKGIVTERL